MQFYRIYVRLKKGGQAMGRELYAGSPPDHGTELDVQLVTDRMVKARINSRREGSKRVGSADPVVTEVYADEV